MARLVPGLARFQAHNRLVEGDEMRDLRPLYCVGLPVASMLLCLAIGVVNPDFYRSWVRKHEVGLLEQGTVLCLAPAVVLGALAWRRRAKLPAAWLGAWVVLITAGALYYGGEECSWGQNYFGWVTPENWSAINDQRETNLHNTSAAFDQVPRDLLTLAAGVGLVAPVVLARRLRRSDPRTKWLPWFLPTAAVIPAAGLALAVGLPQKFYGKYDKTAEAQTWFTEMFLAGRHSELKEFFLAVFILMYVWSLATRLATLSKTPAALDREPTGIHPQAFDARTNPRRSAAA